MSETEVRRVENVPVEDELVYRFNCSVCGRAIGLHFNGGELDAEQCCGHSYRLESRGTDFVEYVKSTASPRSR